MAAQVNVTTGWEKHLTDDAEGPMTKLGQAILDDMRAGAPVETGQLRDSLQLSYDDGVIRIGSDVDYSVYVAKGTHRQSPNPFMQRAVYQRREVRS